MVMLAIAMQLQLSLGGVQAAGVSSIALLVIPASCFWLLWLWCGPAGRDGSVEQLAGAVICLWRTRRLDPGQRQCVLGWTVKAFFLPLMLAWVLGWLGSLQEPRTSGWLQVFVFGMAAMYAVDTLFATIGYLSTHRAIDAHIRSTDATWLGWLSALACYPPLSAVVLRQWLDYKDGLEWQDCLQAPPLPRCGRWRFSR